MLTFLVGFFLLLSTLFPNNANASNEKKVTAKVYFSLGDQYELPLTQEKKTFDCSDKIFAVVELNNLPKTKYELSIVWKDPTDTERERAEYPFTVARDETRLWSWLSLAPSGGAAMIQWVNPAAGLEEFIGPWTVEVRINNKKISTKHFDVIC